MAVTTILSGTIPVTTETASVAVPLSSRYVVTIKGTAGLQVSIDGIEWFAPGGSVYQSASASPLTTAAFVLTGVPVGFMRLTNYSAGPQAVTAKVLDS